MSAATIQIRILKRCMIGRDRVGEPGEIVALAPIDAAGLLGSGRGVVVNEVAAKEAIDAWNASAIRSEAQSQPRAPQPSAWSVFPPEAPRPWARH